MAFDAIARFGRVDILINNAGMYYPESFSRASLTQWNDVVGGFLTGPFLCSKVIAPLMMQERRGNIIHLGSYAATSDDANAFAYGVVRAGMVRLTKKMAADLAPHGIAVNSYGPGFMLTERVVQILGDSHPRLPEAHAPEESVPHVVWIAQQSVETFTGQVVYFDDWQTTWGPATEPADSKVSS